MFFNIRLLLVIWALVGLANGTATGGPVDTSVASSLEDPSEAVATTSQDFESEDVCLRCYDKVKVVQDMIAVQTALLERQKKLIVRKNKAAAEAARVNVASSNSDQENRHTRLNSRRFDTNDNENNNNHENNNYQDRLGGASSSTVRSRTLQVSEPIVISRLRVARAAAVTSNKSGSYNSKKDPELKRLKQEQQKQLNATCKSLQIVQDCLGELSRECIGNLQFHSLEVYSNQWHSKLSCPYRNNPGLRVFPGLRSTYIQEETSEQQLKVPVPRRISSNEEVRSRLHEMFPNGFARPFGVMLKPTLTTTASQRFGQTLQQQQEANKQQQLRNFSGHLNQIPGQQEQQTNFNQARNDFYIGRVLLIPCFIAILVALVALTSLYYWL